jgi:NNP family nitrate/nitrite transporter-like MFS transporter
MTSSSSRGHWPTLAACFLHFDVSFMLWVLLGALGVFVADASALNASDRALVVAIPILSGSLLRVPFGVLSDRIGAKRVGTAMLAFLYVPLGLGWMAGDGLGQLLAIGVMLGVAGASFAVALPLASRCYPPDRQGLAMGIAAAGNSGTVLTNLLAPRLAAEHGWHDVMGLAMLPLTFALVGFVLLARESPRRDGRTTASMYLSAARQLDLWWFCALYAITFGGYVGLSSFLPILLRDQYGVSPVTAGSLTALVACVGSLTRPVGGYLADRVDGATLLSALLMGVAAVYATSAMLPALPAMIGTWLMGMACLGLGNGVIFQMVPQRFQREIGLATGVVGSIGGVGGFVLPMVLGYARTIFGSFAPGFVFMALMTVAGLVFLRSRVASGAGSRVSVSALDA